MATRESHRNSTHNEGKSVVAEEFIRTLKNKIHMTTLYDFNVKNVFDKKMIQLRNIIISQNNQNEAY